MLEIYCLLLVSEYRLTYLMILVNEHEENRFSEDFSLNSVCSNIPYALINI